jgi:hypothetical protein
MPELNLDLVKQEKVAKVSVRENIPSLLRPAQVKELNDEVAAIENTLLDPLARKQIDVKGQKAHLHSLKSAKADFEPQAFSSENMSRAVELEIELRDNIVSDGMPTAAEMRKNPPGAVDKHLRFERRNKKNIQVWKNLRLRLGASGHDFGGGIDGNAGNLANLEMYRPKDKADELSMDDAQIEGKQYHLNEGKTVIFTKAEMLIIKAELPEVYQKLAFLTADQRYEVRAQIAIALEEAGVKDAEKEEAEGPVKLGPLALPEEGPFSMKDQSWFELQKAIKAATGEKPKNKVDAVRLVHENNLT